MSWKGTWHDYGGLQIKDKKQGISSVTINIIIEKKYLLWARHQALWFISYYKK